MLLTSIVAAIAIVLTPTEPGALTDRPDALMKAIESRSRLQTGRVHFSRTLNGLDDGNGITVSMTARIGGADELWTNLGREDLDDSQAGSAPRVHAALRKDGRVLSSGLDFGIMHYSDAGEPGAEMVPHIRTLGLVGGIGYFEPERLVWGSDPDKRRVEYSESAEGELRLVEAREGEFTRKWWIDPARGWAVVRFEGWLRDEKVLESRTSLRQFGAQWFPEMTEAYTKDFRDGKEPLEVVVVHAAEFNSPDLPASVSLEEAGIEPGMYVFYWNPDRIRPGEENHMWDGEKPVSATEFFARMKAGELERGPRNRAAMEEARKRASAVNAASAGSRHLPPASQLAPPPTDWEIYTSNFIARYRLDERQSEKAWALLRNCENARKEVIERFERRLNSLKADAENASARREELVKESGHEQDRIFESRLKAGLEKLPSSAQRKAVEGKRDVKPSSGGPEKKP